VLEQSAGIGVDRGAVPPEANGSAVRPGGAVNAPALRPGRPTAAATSDLLEQRHPLMQAWADYLSQPPAEIIRSTVA